MKRRRVFLASTWLRLLAVWDKSVEWAKSGLQSSTYTFALGPTNIKDRPGSV